MELHRKIIGNNHDVYTEHCYHYQDYKKNNEIDTYLIGISYCLKINQFEIVQKVEHNIFIEKITSIIVIVFIFLKYTYNEGTFFKYTYLILHFSSRPLFDSRSKIVDILKM